PPAPTDPSEGGSPRPTPSDCRAPTPEARMRDSWVYAPAASRRPESSPGAWPSTGGTVEPARAPEPLSHTAADWPPGPPAGTGNTGDGSSPQAKGPVAARPS